MIITAADITHDSDVEILNPDLHIATLVKTDICACGCMLYRGRGYAHADQNKREDLANWRYSDRLYLHSNFTR